MADQVSPLGSLGTGTTVVALPTARAQSVSDNSASGNASASSGSASPAPVSPAQADATKAGDAQGKAADVNAQTINAQLKLANSSLEFKVDKSTGISYFKVVDATTGQVIRQVPSAEVLAMAQKLQDFSSHKDPAGILMDQEG